MGFKRFAPGMLQFNETKNKFISIFSATKVSSAIKNYEEERTHWKIHVPYHKMEHRKQ